MASTVEAVTVGGVGGSCGGHARRPGDDVARCPVCGSQAPFSLATRLAERRGALHSADEGCYGAIGIRLSGTSSPEPNGPNETYLALNAAIGRRTGLDSAAEQGAL